MEKRGRFFKRRKRASAKKDTRERQDLNLDFYGNIEEVQEYHNPYLTVVDLHDEKNKTPVTR